MPDLTTTTLDLPPVVPIPTGLGDPPVRPDGRCALDGCNHRLPRGKKLRKYAGVQLDMDPFCSAQCCRTHFGVEWRTEFDQGEAAA